MPLAAQVPRILRLKSLVFGIITGYIKYEHMDATLTHLPNWEFHANLNLLALFNEHKSKSCFHRIVVILNTKLSVETIFKKVIFCRVQ